MSDELIKRDLFYKVVNLATAVHRELGMGLPDEIYKQALSIELKSDHIDFERNKEVEIFYKKKKLDTIILDLVVKNNLLVAVVSDEDQKKKSKTLMLSLLRLLGKQTGLLLDYGHETLYYKRIVYKNRKQKNMQSAY